MSQRVNELCDSLRNRLDKLEDRLESAKQKLQAAPQQSPNTLQSQAENLRSRVDAKRPAIDQAREKVEQWRAQERALLRQTFDQWKANRQFGKLEAKAQETEKYADAAVDIVLSAIDEAEVATLEAVAAWQDVDTFQVVERQPRK